MREAQNVDSLLAVVLFGLVIFFLVSSELSIFGELLRIAIALGATLVSLGAVMSGKERNVFFLNLALTIFFLALFFTTYGVRIHGIGDWFVAEVFEVTLFDVVATGILGGAFYAVTLRVSIDLFESTYQRKEKR